MSKIVKVYKPGEVDKLVDEVQKLWRGRNELFMLLEIAHTAAKAIEARSAKGESFNKTKFEAFEGEYKTVVSLFEDATADLIVRAEKLKDLNAEIKDKQVNELVSKLSAHLGKVSEGVDENIFKKVLLAYGAQPMTGEAAEMMKDIGFKIDSKSMADAKGRLIAGSEMRDYSKLAEVHHSKVTKTSAELL